MSNLRTQENIPAPKPHICWLGGWGIAEHNMLAIAQRLLPQAEHTTLTPTEASLTTLCRKLAHDTAAQATDATRVNAPQPHSTVDAPPFALQPHSRRPDIIAGYSTGAFLLLRELEQIAPLPAYKQPLLLFAPFVDFRAESGLGGRVVTTRLKMLLRRLRSDPLAAITDFYQQSGITLGLPTELPYAQSDLVWGIEQLAQTTVPLQTLDRLQHGEPYLNIKAWVGTHDALLDAQKIAALFANRTCRIAEDASHDLTTLLAAANAEGALLQ